MVSRRFLMFLMAASVSMPAIVHGAGSEKDSMLKQQLIQMHYARLEAYRQDLAKCYSNIHIDVTKPLGTMGSPGATGGISMTPAMAEPCKKLLERYQAETEYGHFVLGL